MCDGRAARLASALALFVLGRPSAGVSTPTRIAAALRRTIARRDAARARLRARERAEAQALAERVGVVLLDLGFGRDWIEFVGWLRTCDLEPAELRAAAKPMPDDDRGRAAWMRRVVRAGGGWAVRRGETTGSSAALRALVERALAEEDVTHTLTVEERHAPDKPAGPR